MHGGRNVAAMLQLRDSDKLPAKHSCTSPRCEERAIQAEEPRLLMAPREAWSAGRSYLGQYYRRHVVSASSVVTGW